MPTSGDKARRQTALGRIVLKKASNDSGVGVGSLAPSSARSIREVPTTAPSSSTARSLSGSSKSKRSDLGQLSHSPALRSVASTGIVQSSNVGRSRGKVRRVHSWLKEQQRINSRMDETSRNSTTKVAGTPCNPYLAYPGLARYTAWQDGDGDDVDTLSSFVIVEEEESGEGGLGVSDPADTFERTQYGMLSTSSPAHSNSIVPSSLRPSRPASLLSVSSWRQLPFAKTLPRHRYPSAPGEPIDLSTPPTSIRISSSRRRSPIPEELLPPETRRTAQNKTSCSTLKALDTPRNTVRRRLGGFMRPHENAKTSLQSPTSSSSTSSPRPSTSASATTATTSTAVEKERRSETGVSPKRLIPKFNLKLSKTARPAPEDIRLDSPTRSSFSSAIQTEEPDIASPVPGQLFSAPEDTPGLSKRQSQSNIFRDKRHNASSSALSTLSIGSIGTIASNINGRASSVFSNASTTKRKRLVVSGIARDNTAAVQGLRKWCERFGELRQMTRMPNGDLLIDFKRADVADTVCRISARVHIAEVGSVNVSWLSGKRH